ncbi:MAG: Hsp20/alpha crystallin family protein [Halobacteriovoraceae bacterium]|nr:Hsp20/alpha crystallin family protein [Halobacteriovoraceae bacterium]
MSILRTNNRVPVQREDAAKYRDPFNALFDEFFNDWKIPTTENFQKGFAPALNVHENETAYVLETELPGVNKEDINIDLKDNILTIKGEKKSFNEEKKNDYHIVERGHGNFYRSIKLPNDIDKEKIEAKMENGVLHVEVSKCQKAKETQRTISIK